MMIRRKSSSWSLTLDPGDQTEGANPFVRRHWRDLDNCKLYATKNDLLKLYPVAFGGNRRLRHMARPHQTG